MIDMTTIVIGAGAAGLMAAGRLAERGAKTIIAERNPIVGKKLRITGKGRCNLTNSCEVEDIISHVPTNGKFLYSAIYNFTNADTMSFFETHGVPLKTERGGRVFPVSDSARDVAEALRRYVAKGGAKLIHARAAQILTADGAVTGVKFTDGREIACDSVIIATGGKSYPLTGSTGDGYKMAAALGHTIVEPKASLVPLETVESWTADVMGLQLKNIALGVNDARGRRIYDDFGEMLFTHFGVSGPVILSASAHMKKEQKYTLEIDLKPALSAEKLDARIVRDFEKYHNKQLIHAMEDLLPKALIPIVLQAAGVDEHKAANSVTRQERTAIGAVLKSLTLTVKGKRPIDEAIITSGGVKTSEINPSTMESRIVKGLYFAGEVIDVDAYTGGFNLQIAFSTARLAAESITENI